jgi:hypothetical protein
VRQATQKPLVVAVCSVPLVHEALAAALEGFADVQPFPAGRGDTAGLLGSLRPAAVVVDSDEEAAQAETYARECDCPVVHLSLRQQTMRLFRGQGWEEEPTGVSPDAIRNLLVGELFGARAGP